MPEDNPSRVGGIEVTALLTHVIQTLGEFGIFLAMALESACIPLPSEIIMPFGGFLVATGHLHFWPVVLSGALGNLIGSLAAYAVGLYGGRAGFKRYGRYLQLSERHLRLSERWFASWGSISVLLGRILPIVRTFISLPAGLARMPVGRFSVLTFLGCLPWVYGLTWAGVKFGQEWQRIDRFVHPITYGVAGALGVCVIALVTKWFIIRPAKAE
ncbi:MAG: DedA family protein [Alicyclobacillus sp.]|nr:DedA family protein [Alicyclobacillus sp.]